MKRNRVVFRPWVVSALFRGESIRPILVGLFGRESFRPWVVSAQCRGDTLNFSASYVGLDPVSTAYPNKISGIP